MMSLLLLNMKIQEVGSYMLDKMIDAARRALENAYAPYSSIQVGCAITTSNGKLFSGCNVENAAFPSSQCAEASAIGAMVTGGKQKISEMVVMNVADFLCFPCGNCRQIIQEFGSPDVKVHLCGLEGLKKTFLFKELLPNVFDGTWVEK